MPVTVPLGIFNKAALVGVIHMAFGKFRITEESSHISRSANIYREPP